MHTIHVEVFWRILPAGLRHIPQVLWERFSRGLVPLPDARAPGRVDLLALTLRDGRCEAVEPLSVLVDEHGYLYRPDLRLRPLPYAPQLLDARAIFLGRYLKHAHRWTPSPELVAQAVQLVRRIGGPTSMDSS